MQDKFGRKRSFVNRLLTAMVSNPYDSNTSCNTRMLFDDCSQRTYITKAVREKLQLYVPTIRNDRISVNGFGGHETAFEEVDIVQIKLNMRNGLSIFIEAAAVPVVCSPLPDQRTKSAKLNYSHLQNLYLSDYSDDKDKSIDILIGENFYWDIITGKVIRGASGPVALESGIGWILSGRSAAPNNSREVSTMLSISRRDTREEEEDTRDVVVDTSLKEFFQSESVNGAKENVLTNFKRDIQFSGEKYVVKLPEKDNHEFLPDNYQLCLKRFLCNEKRLQNHEMKDLPEQYRQVFEEYKANGMDCK